MRYLTSVGSFRKLGCGDDSKATTCVSIDSSDEAEELVDPLAETGALLEGGVGADMTAVV